MNLIGQLRTLPLLKAMELYWRYLPVRPYRWQLDQWQFAWGHNNCCILRSRGGSKTFDFTNWLVFRVLRTDETWIWMPPKGGQLKQAKIYFEKNPFVREIKTTRSSNYVVHLWSGRTIMCGIISTSNLGLRCDGIIYDEFEDLQPKQEFEIYPQMAGMMTASTVHKRIYLGTRWIATLFDEFCEKYPTMTRPWDDIQWLIDAGMIQEEIDEKVIPDWQIDLLYRCLPTAPHGVLFPHLQVVDLKRFYWEAHEIQYGVDFGGKDIIVGVVIRGDDAYVVEEYEVELEMHNDALDFLRGKYIECEGGGYNDSDRYGNKSGLMVHRLQARRVPVTNKWKAARQMVARQHLLHVDSKLTPNIYKDLKTATFGPDGLYLKDTIHPCHYLDAFFHCMQKNRSSYIAAPVPRATSIRAGEKARNVHLQD